jgi:hypothetical protein
MFLTFLRTAIWLAALSALSYGADFSLEIPPVPLSADISGQPVTVLVSGRISGGNAGQPLNLILHADLGDFQNHLTELLKAKLDQSNRCGERISLEKAVLDPAPPSADMTATLHFEKWACLKAFGKENAKRLVGGNGVIHVTLTPRVENGSAVRLDATVGAIDADGSLGELLRSGSLGDALRDRIRESLTTAIQKSSNLDGVLPAQVRPLVTMDSVKFGDLGRGRLGLYIDGSLTLSNEQARGLLEQFRNGR